MFVSSASSFPCGYFIICHCWCQEHVEPEEPETFAGQMTEDREERQVTAELKYLLFS